MRTTNERRRVLRAVGRAHRGVIDLMDLIDRIPSDRLISADARLGQGEFAGICMSCHAPIAVPIGERAMCVECETHRGCRRLDTRTGEGQ